MTGRLYAAPMEGLTGWMWRQIHARLFGPADKYFTPFLSPNANCSFQTKEREEILPEHNAGLPVVPQLITNRSQHFIWAARQLQQMGYEEVNFNLGCPAGTVAAKGKGSGFLSFPEQLDRCLGEIFEALPDLRISLKTRIGRHDTAEWEGLLAIYRKYPLAELIVHPRVQRAFYRGKAHREVYEATCRDLPFPVFYNGDIFTPADGAAFLAGHPETAGVMLGRGLMRDPALLRQLRGGPPAGKEEVRLYHDQLLAAYRQRMSGDLPALHKMWELWTWLQDAFPGAGPYLKQIRKARSLPAYGQVVDALFRDCPWAPEGPVGLGDG